MREILFILLLFLGISLYAQTPANDPNWHLQWQDNFNTFNSSIWKKDSDNHFGQDSTYYLPQNVTVDNGHLIIKSWDNNHYGYDHQTTSGNIQTQLSHYIQYGYVEAKIKLPVAPGLHAAFWTQEGAVASNNYEEMDIFEMVPGQKNCGIVAQNENYMTSNVHFIVTKGPCDTITKNPPYAYPANSYINDYTQWHTYGMEWSPSRIIYYIDNKPVRYIINRGPNNRKIYTPTRIIIGYGFDLLLPPFLYNYHFPYEMQVDYVKVYKLNKNCNDYIYTSNYNFSTYNDSLKNYINIGEGGGNNSLSSGQSVFLRASKYIKLSGNFTVPLGATFYADANDICPTDLSGQKCAMTFNPCSYNFANYDNSKVYKIIDLGGDGCTMNIEPVNQDIIMKATDEITIHPGVTITPANNHIVQLEITPCPQ